AKLSLTYISDKYSVAYVTVPSPEVGKSIGRGLVKEKLAACVNIIPQVTSIYEWKNEINEDNENGNPPYLKWIGDNVPETKCSGCKD
ncbi:Uncharacterized protein OBRU01_25031, partial [Operophtera brumata]